MDNYRKQGKDMRHTDESFATMLLTLPLTPEGEEAVKPLSGAELGYIAAQLSLMGDNDLGSLMGRDVSGLMRLLNLTEAEAYRVCILLGRDLLLYKLLEDCMDRGIEVLTPFDKDYPARLKGNLGGIKAPPVFVKGNMELLSANYVGILGIEGMKTPEAILTGVNDLVSQASEYGLGIATEDSLGACRAARTAAAESGARLICALDGGINTLGKKYEPQVEDGSALLISLSHPDAPAGMKDVTELVCALSCAAFIATTDGKRDEAEIIRRRICDFLYVFDDPALPGNAYAAAKGFERVNKADVASNYDKWTGNRGEQLSFL